MRWQILFLEEFDGDLEILLSEGTDIQRLLRPLHALIEDEFKSRRLEDFLRAGSPSPFLDRLGSSQFQPSVRIQLAHEFRATAWCHAPRRLLVVTHAFRKASDPDYKRALRLHDERLAAYVNDITGFLEKKRRKRN